jgi:Na+/H+-translocating membrane pyrophosphatase
MQMFERNSIIYVICTLGFGFGGSLIALFMRVGDSWGKRLLS